jgi:hypothetical protein
MGTSRDEEPGRLRPPQGQVSDNGDKNNTPSSCTAEESRICCCCCRQHLLLPLPQYHFSLFSLSDISWLDAEDSTN